MPAIAHHKFLPSGHVIAPAIVGKHQVVFAVAVKQTTTMADFMSQGTVAFYSGL